MTEGWSAADALAAAHAPAVIVEGLPDEAYHADRTAVSSSVLKYFVPDGEKTPAHYQDSLLAPKKERPAHFAVGTAVHCAVLEPHRFDDAYAIALDRADYPDAIEGVTGLRAACKAHGIKGHSKMRKDELVTALLDAGCTTRTWEGLCREYALSNGGKVILPRDTWEAVLGMRDAVRAHPLASWLLAKGRPELTVVWRDPETETLCKTRFDWQQDNFVVDLKTAASAWGPAFRRDVEGYDYELSAAMYLTGAEWAGIVRPSGARDYHVEMASHWAWVVVEKTRPYPVLCAVASPARMRRGFDKFRAAIRLFTDCKSSGEFPGYAARFYEVQ